MSTGLFITFEGIEGSGKTTQIELLAHFLRQRRVPHLVTREPGGSPLGERLRDVILDQVSLPVSPMAELLLIEADRAQHVTEVIRPALAQGKVVVCDRFTDATVAYQGGGRGVPQMIIEQANRWATDGLSPVLTILVECSVEVGMARAGGRDRFEREGFAFHERVRREYLRIAREHPGRVKVVAGERDHDAVQEEIRGHLRPLLANLRAPRTQTRSGRGVS